MALFKAEALPIAVADIASSIDRASRNSVTAITLLHEFVRIDPRTAYTADIVLLLHRDIFRLHEDCYPVGRIVRILASLGVEKGEVDPDCGYWAVYAYLFSLLPALVEHPHVDGERWTEAEYEPLKITCFAHWCNQHEDGDYAVLVGDYTRVCEAQKAWFGRESKLKAAIDSLASSAADDIVRAFPRQPGCIREGAFRLAVRELIDSLYSTFQDDLAKYFSVARGFHFLASDPATIPPHINRESALSRGAQPAPDFEEWLKDRKRRP